ncbi:MAG: LPS export ABC transporter ATP-binding protein [Alphaproteobacteria bacterium]|nr:LPS export ABC transporter ATP-binding protein [Alphaproteobacteria bacterium]
MILKAEGISKSYKGRVIINDINLTFKVKEISGILGPNGAGKTTLFSILAGIVIPDSGNVYINDKNITKYKIYQRSRKGIVYLPQDSSIFRGLNVEDNIKAILEISKQKNKIDDQLNELLERFAITHIRKSRAQSLSGGERRKVEIARAIATNPKFLLLDEPFAGIDPISINEITNIINGLKNSGLGIIITDHNARETLKIIDKGYIVANGKILAEGSANEILESELTKKLYLGSTFKL